MVDDDDARDGDDIHSFTMSHNHFIPPSIVHVGFHLLQGPCDSMASEDISGALCIACTKIGSIHRMHHQ